MSGEWIPIIDHPDYMISIDGRVKSLSRKRTLNNSIFWTKEIILKPKMSNSGYWYVDVGRSYRTYVHRLIALHFIPNPENKRTVNHKDGNKLNNSIDNLEWMTYSENHKHAYKNGLHIAPKPRLGKFGKDNPTAKKIIQMDKNGHELGVFYGVYEVERLLGFTRSCIHDCCNGKRNTANGYKWRYA